MFTHLTIAAVTALAATTGDTVVRLPKGVTIEVSVSARPVILSSTTNDLVTVEGARVARRGNRLTIREERNGPAGESPVTITVPDWATVEMEVVNGSIQLMNPPAMLHATTIDGPIVSTGGTGRLVLESVAGAVLVRAFRGDRLVATSVSGAITVEGATGTVRLSSITERIAMRDLHGDSVTAETTNGRIDWVGRFRSSGEYRFASHNGEITLALPPAPSALMEGEMFNGTFSTSLPATHEGLTPSRREPRELLGRRFIARFGTGQARVKVTTFNGTISVVDSSGL